MTDDAVPPTSCFVRLDDRRFVPTALVGGAWGPDEQHIAPTFGLVLHAIDRFVAARGGDDLVVGRASFDILGVPPLAEFAIDVEVLRPGRTIELVEAVVSRADTGRAFVRARVWRMRAYDTTAVAGGAAPALPAPADTAPWAMTDLWSGGFIASLDVRSVARPEPGRSTTWVSSPVPLLAGEPVGALAHFARLVDTANGVATRESPREWHYPNLDLTLHLHRQPAGEWVGLDTTVVFGAGGQGTTSTTLHDEAGAVGRVEQLLTVRPYEQ